MNNPNRLLILAVLSFVHTFAFAAEAINIDIGIEGGGPSEAYGAGSEQTGIWNVVSAPETPVHLVRTSGVSSNATVVVTGRDISNYGWGWATDPRRFFVDLMYEDRPDAVWTLTVSGLENGQYDIFYYTSVAFPTGVMTINGIQVPSLPGNPDHQILRLTRGVSFDVLQDLEVTDGTLEIIDVSDEPLTGLTGIQIVPHRQNLPNPFLLTSSWYTENIIEFDSFGNKVLGPTVLDGGQNIWATTGGDHDPVYIAWGPSGELFAGYGITNQIRRYSETGIDLGAFVSTGLVSPLGLAFDTVGHLYVAHGNAAGKVTRYDSSGAFIDDFVTGLHYPSDLAFDSLGNLYVAERYRGQVQKFDSAGNPIVLIDGFADPFGLAVGPDDNLYVADTTSNIQRFEPDGTPLGIFGSGPGGYSWSLRFGPLGNLYLATSSYVYSWQADGTPNGVFGDAIGTGLAFFPSDSDTDGDGVPNDQDICEGGDDNVDADGDSVPDFCDPCPIDPDNDADGDGVCGDVDICPLGNDNVDTDGDGLADACDVCLNDPSNDADGDGVCGDVDNCPLIENANQANNDGDSAGDVCDLDDDNDEVLDENDNCPLDINQDQADFDGDGAGDQCDSDDDNDNVLDNEDECPMTVTGEVVEAGGCSVNDLNPCENENKWKNHGAYVRSVAHTSEDFVASGLITEVEKETIISTAGSSSCGAKK